MIRIADYRTRDFIEARVRRVVRVESLGECWEWTGAKAGGRYGHFGITVNGKQQFVKAHRASLELFTGELVAGDDEVMHRCDNGICCRPAHLFVGTHADNMQDMRTKGRAVGHPGARNPNVRLTPDDVDHIRSVPKRYGVNRALSLLYEVSPEHISLIRNGKSWPASAA